MYTVQAGDTALSIAAEFGIAVESVVWNNETVTGPTDEIDAGELVRVPGADGIIHEVRPGETLAVIANTYDANVGAIVNFRSNGLSDPNLLQVGAVLLVPGGRIESPPAPPPAEPTPTATPQATATPAPEAGEDENGEDGGGGE
ncbi:MAG: LysM peptidoglycan-binding domain-containing protein [Chloroflexi bacterium]|nr:LysM peptidoglycan-binding domain-containing protein [Chloroflexota bacterium]